MAGITIHNGAVVDRNSHVVSDVPPFSIVGGNPAKVIGYRFDEDTIEKLQLIQWWNWMPEELIKYYDLFNEDVDTFCEKFIAQAIDDYQCVKGKRNIVDDSYFAFVDYYDSYNSYSHIIESFLNKFANEKDKRLCLFIQRECGDSQKAEKCYSQLLEICKFVDISEHMKCKIEVLCGDESEAMSAFLNCSHFVTTRCYDIVHFSCMADLLGIETLLGTDSIVTFEKAHNIKKSL